MSEHDDYTVGGCTALFDAIGGAIHLFNSNQIRQMLQRQKTRYGWEFLFLGANIDAVETAKNFGIEEERAVTYKCDAKGTALNYEAIGEA